MAPSGLGLAQPVARGRGALVLEFSAQTPMEVAALSCPALILAWGELENTTGNFQRVLYFRAQVWFGCQAFRAPLLLCLAGRGFFCSILEGQERFVPLA